MGPGVCRAALYHRVWSRHARLGERTALEAHTQTRACAIFRDLVQPDRTVARARAVCLPAGAQWLERRLKRAARDRICALKNALVQAQAAAQTIPARGQERAPPCAMRHRGHVARWRVMYRTAQ